MIQAAAATLVSLLFVPIVLGQAETRTIFVANDGNLEGSVSALAVHPDGTLQLINRVITGTRPSLSQPCPGCNPYAISITPNGRYLATGHASSNDPTERITVFQVAGDGSISQIGAYSVPGTPMDVAWITDDLLAATRTDPNPNQVLIFRFNPADLTLNQVYAANVGTFSTYLVVDPLHHYLYVNDSGAADLMRVFHVETNGALTLIDSEPTSPYYNLDLAITHDGTKLYAAGGITSVILGYNVATDGTLTRMATWPFPQFGDSPKCLAFSGDDRYLLAGHGRDATVRSASIDPATGALTYTGNVFDVGLQGTLGDVKTLDELFFVTRNSTAGGDPIGVYSFTLNADGSFTPNGPIAVTGGIAPQAIATWAPNVYLGDLNCDDVINFGDINPFVLALTGYDAYHAAYPNCRWLNADINGDSQVDFGDINPFVALLTPD